MASIASAINTQINQTASSSNDTKKATQGADAIANKDAFLQLLVAQIKNQDPMKPADGVQFLTQLTQFSQLEQLMGIRQTLAGAAAASDATQPAQTT